jgi:hypothetical protein
VNLDSKLYFKIYQQLILYEYHIKTRVVKKLYSTTNLLFLYWLFYVYAMANCFMFMWWQIVLCLCDGKLFYVYVMTNCFMFMWWQIVLCLCDGKLFYVYVMAKIRNNLYCVIKSRRKKMRDIGAFYMEDLTALSVKL